MSDLPERWSVDGTNVNGAPMIALGDRDDYAVVYGPEADALAERIANLPELERLTDRLGESVAALLNTIRGLASGAVSQKYALLVADEIDQRFSQKDRPD